MARNTPPCKECQERHTACHDHCAKYAGWKADLQKAQAKEKEYLLQRREDFLMSEQCESPKRKWKAGKVYGKQ